jgi:hypothetical protein
MPYALGLVPGSDSTENSQSPDALVKLSMIGLRVKSQR